MDGNAEAAVTELAPIRASRCGAADDEEEVENELNEPTSSEERFIEESEDAGVGFKLTEATSAAARWINAIAVEDKGFACILVNELDANREFVVLDLGFEAAKTDCTN